MPKIKRSPLEPFLGGRYVVGVDPGGSGAIVRVHSSGDHSLTRIWNMPDSPKDILTILQCVGPDGDECDLRMWHPDPVIAFMEQVTGYAGGGGDPGARMFKFGMNYGFLKMALTACEIPYETVTSQKWQKTYSMSKRPGEEKAEFKRRLKEKAQQVCPHLNWTLNTCDAYLIAEYGRRLVNAQSR